MKQILWSLRYLILFSTIFFRQSEFDGNYHINWMTVLFICILIDFFWIHMADFWWKITGNEFFPFDVQYIVQVLNSLVFQGHFWFFFHYLFDSVGYDSDNPDSYKHEKEENT